MLILLYSSNNCLDELKQTIVHSEIPLSKNPKHAETNQIIYRADQLTGFYNTRASGEKYFQTDHNWY